MTRTGRARQRTGRSPVVSAELRRQASSTAAAQLRQLDFHAHELALIDADLGQVALARADVLRLMTIPGVDATVNVGALFTAASRVSSSLTVHAGMTEGSRKSKIPRPTKTGWIMNRSSPSNWCSSNVCPPEDQRPL